MLKLGGDAWIKPNGGVVWLGREKRGERENGSHNITWMSHQYLTIILILCNHFNCINQSMSYRPKHEGPI